MPDLTYATPVASPPGVDGSTEYIPGDVVRQLVAWSERDIDMLRAELDVALAEAEAVERRLALLDPGASRTGTPANPMPPSTDGPAVTPAEADEWQPLAGWVGSDPSIAMPTVPAPAVSDPTIAVPVVHGPVSYPSIAMPTVPAPTVSDPTIAIPAVTASPAWTAYPQPVSDPTAVVPAVTGPAAPGPAGPESAVAPASTPSTPSTPPPGPTGPGRTGRTGRTTVVYRPPASDLVEIDHSGNGGQPIDDQIAADPSPPATRNDLVRGRASLGDRLRTRWMMKAGMVIAVLGLVFLKFG